MISYALARPNKTQKKNKLSFAQSHAKISWKSSITHIQLTPINGSSCHLNYAVVPIGKCSYSEKVIFKVKVIVIENVKVVITSKMK